MTSDLLVPGLVSATTSATPLVLAAVGETVTERAGVLNLGVEGMMLVGAVAAFSVTALTGSDILGITAGALAGAALAALFAFLTLTLAANQVASGLAITIFGGGLSSLLGASFVGRRVAPLAHVHIPLLSNIPLLGPLLLRYDPLVYLSIAITGFIAWALHRTRAGLVLRAVGESDVSAYALGYNVLRIRFLAVLFGGALAGLAGAYLSLAATPMWMEGLTAGRGWIALALVVFGAWRPWRVLAGAYLFGAITVLQFYLQGAGFVAVPTQFLAMIPYLATIVVLTVISSGGARRRLRAPASLGNPFRATT
jgi:simple sugar transport system permease protein